MTDPSIEVYAAQRLALVEKDGQYISRILKNNLENQVK